MGAPLRTLFLAAGAWAMASASLAQSAGHGHHVAGPLTEPGQGAFAALAEVVARLESNTETDWSRVDIAALREHLVDMNLLILATTTRTVPVPGGLEFEVSAEGRALGAAQRMVPAHAAELDRREGWRATGRATPDGAVLRVVVSDPGEQQRIRALGFYGLMALEQHHQAHHWALASGRDPHAH